MSLNGINHLTFAVRNLEASFAFYREVLGFRPLVKWKHGAYLAVGSDWIVLTLDEETRPQALPEYTHTAFTVAPADFAAMSRRILASGAPVWQANSSEGDSLYFLDPNGHKLEIHASDLDSRLKSAREAGRWEDATFF